MDAEVTEQEGQLLLDEEQESGAGSNNDGRIGNGEINGIADSSSSETNSGLDEEGEFDEEIPDDSSSLSSGLSIDDCEDGAPGTAGGDQPRYLQTESEVVRYLREKYPEGRLPAGARQKITRTLNKWQRSQTGDAQAGPVFKRNSNSWRHRHTEMTKANLHVEGMNKLTSSNHPLPFPRPRQLPAAGASPSSHHQSQEEKEQEESGQDTSAAIEGHENGGNRSEGYEDSSDTDIFEGLRLPADSQFGPFNFEPYLTAINTRLAIIEAELRAVDAEVEDDNVQDHGGENID